MKKSVVTNPLCVLMQPYACKTEPVGIGMFVWLTAILYQFVLDLTHLLLKQLAADTI